MQQYSQDVHHTYKVFIIYQITMSVGKKQGHYLDVQLYVQA